VLTGDGFKWCSSRQSPKLETSFLHHHPPAAQKKQPQQQTRQLVRDKMILKNKKKDQKMMVLTSPSLRPISNPPAIVIQRAI